MKSNGSEELADGLLSFLRRSLDEPELSYTVSPRRLTGGNETAIYVFAVNEAPDPFDAGLVLRLFRPSASPSRPAREAAVQNSLSTLGYGAPRVLCSESDRSILGGGFLIMEHRPGVPVVATLANPTGDGTLRPPLGSLLADSAQLFVKMPRALAQAQVRLHEIDAQLFAEAFRKHNLDPSELTLDARLAMLSRQIRQASLDALRPALNWIEKHRPRTKDVAICHGDIQPNNVLMDGNQTTAVLDWTHTTLAPPSLDVAFTKVAIETAPIALPSFIMPAAQRLQRMIARRYLAAYCDMRPLDTATLSYFEAFRCIELLSMLAARRRENLSEPDAWNSSLGITRLMEHFNDIAHVDLRSIPKSLFI